MGMKRNIILAVSGIVLIFLGIILIVVDAINDDKKKDETNINDILSYYDKLQIEANVFNEKRKEYANVVLSDLYDESVSGSYQNWINQVTGYQETVNKIIEISEPLSKLCNRTYGNNDVNNACRSYQISYETCINYFVKDIEEFNTFITSYLEDHSNKNIKLFELDSNKYYYIDVDDDGEFIGKN